MQHREKRLDTRGQPVCSGNRVSQSVSPRGSRAYIPEFGYVLVGNAKLFAVSNERSEGLPCGSHQGVIALDRTHQNIHIDENWHLPAIGVKILAAEGLIRYQWSFWKTIGPYIKLRGPLIGTEALGL